MPVALEYNEVIKVNPLTSLPRCVQCHGPFRINQFAVSVVDRWAHREYLIHNSCEAALIRHLSPAPSQALLSYHRANLIEALTDCQLETFGAKTVLYPETAGYLARLCSELPFQPNGDLTVEQNFEFVNFSTNDWPAEFVWLAEITEEAVHEVGRQYEDLGWCSWRVNDLTVQRYDGRPGLGWHRDFSRDHYLVVVYTVQDSALIEVASAVSDATWRIIAQARTAMALRGYEPEAVIDARPRHNVGPSLGDQSDPENRRISIALRMNATLPARP